jgi:hypothetical protein
VDTPEATMDVLTSIGHAIEFAVSYVEIRGAQSGYKAQYFGDSCSGARAEGQAYEGLNRIMARSMRRGSVWIAP